MKRVALITVILSAIAGAAVAASVTCTFHGWAGCYRTGERHTSGAEKYHCTCGDDVWVRSR